MNCKSAPTQPSVETDHVRLPTQHSLMVAWGQFAQHIGLIEGLMHAPMPQKMVQHAPQKKLLEFQLAILTGVEYLQDINAGPHPLARDQTVAQAWGQDSLAHYSAVSRTLAACDHETLIAVRAVLNAISRPFIQQAVDDALLYDGYLTLDLNLTGRSVSNTSRSYLDAAFGRMGNGNDSTPDCATVTLVDVGSIGKCSIRQAAPPMPSLGCQWSPAAGRARFL